MTPLFALFNEIGILSQLSGAVLESRLPKGTTAAQFGVLNHLVRCGDGETPVEMARAFQVAKTTMTHTLSGLVRLGLVEMRPNPADGRSKRVWLTEAGRAFRARAIADVAPDLARLGAQIPAKKLAGLVAELTELRQLMDADRLKLRP